MYKVWDNFQIYIDFIKDNFKVVENLNVLEIGGFHGKHSNMILSYNPASLTIVEPDVTAYKKLVADFPNSKVLNEDAYDTLYRDEKYDVVVCCGVLYHFHSPLHFLELMANNAQPTYLILDTFLGEDKFQYEDTNVQGNRIVLNRKKYIKKSFFLSKNTLVDSLKELGYDIIYDINFNTLKDPTFPKSKRNTYFMVFKKN